MKEHHVKIRTWSKNRPPGNRELRARYLSCIALNLRKTARVVSSVYDNAVRKAGLRSTQFQILATLAIMPGISVTGLSESIDADRTTIQRSLTRLVKRGWIDSSRGATGNIRELSISPSGGKKLAEAYGYWAGAQKQVVNAIGAGNARRFLRDLKSVRLVTT